MTRIALGISDAGLAHFQAAYPAKGEGSTITKEELFYSFYGLLHSPDYRSRCADNLGKELPRIPAVKRFADFMAFSKADRDLVHWHSNDETVPCHEGVTLEGRAGLLAHSRWMPIALAFVAAARQTRDACSGASLPRSLSSFGR
ncbi:MAG: type ISP restriction/modification enzyme [Prosthecobacter sp.]